MAQSNTSLTGNGVLSVMQQQPLWTELVMSGTFPDYSCVTLFLIISVCNWVECCYCSPCDALLHN